MFLCESVTMLQQTIFLPKNSVKSTDDLIDTSTKENSDHNNASQTHSSNINSENDNKMLMCQLCNFKSSHILGMVRHIKTLRHIQIEQLICLQRMNENLDSLELTEVFKVVEAGKLLNFFSLFSIDSYYYYSVIATLRF